MNYIDDDVLWNDFAISRFFSLDELSTDIIEAFRSGFGGSSHGCKEFETNYIEFDAKQRECIYQGKSMDVSVTISGKNRCIYLILNDGIPWKTPIKLDFADKPFNLVTDSGTKIINVEGLSMIFEKAYAFNMTSMLIKYSEMMREAGENKPIIRSHDKIELFYIDNKIRLNNNIDLKQVYAEYISQNMTLQVTFREVKYQKFNEYGDIQYGGTAEIYCAVPSAEQMLELIEINAKWHEENSKSTYAEALEWASDYLAISTSVTSAVTINEYELDKWNKTPSFGVREHLFECKHIYGSPINLSIYIFQDKTKTTGIQFDFNDYRQYYLFGEYLLIMKSNYQKVLRTIDKMIKENEDTTGKLKCPVCGTYNEDGANVCRECFFDELTPMFLNKEDAEVWKDEVVAPYREKYKNKLL